MKTDMISARLLDSNLLVAIKTTTGFGSIMLNRVFDFVVIFGIIFALCLHRWTVIFVFAAVGYKAFSIIINLYWIIVKFGLFSGIILFVVYLVLFFVLLVLVTAAAVYCMRTCADARNNGLRDGMRWNEFARGCGVFLCVVTAVAFCEWLIYALILSKIVFVA
jgi:hypothetical protein